MGTTSLKKAGALAGSALLLGAATAAAVQPPLAQAAETPAIQTAGDHLAAQGEITAPARIVKGVFSFNQATISNNDELRSGFSKAAAALCSSLPDYTAAVAQELRVSGNGTSLNVTVDEIGEQQGVKTMQVGCACASNAPGGGAIANPEVSGVSVASILASLQ